MYRLISTPSHSQGPASGAFAHGGIVSQRGRGAGRATRRCSGNGLDQLQTYPPQGALQHHPRIVFHEVFYELMASLKPHLILRFSERRPCRMLRPIDNQ